MKKSPKLSTSFVDIKKQYRPSERVRSKIDPQTGRTHQSFREEVDINNLVNNWLKTGIAQFTVRRPQYADISHLPDVAIARNLITRAEQEFSELPLAEREKFASAMDYLEFMVSSDEEDTEQGTDGPLGVTVPSDTLSSSGQKGELKNETQKNDKADE